MQAFLILNFWVCSQIFGFINMKKIIFTNLFFSLLFIYISSCLADISKIYQGIGQVTVLSGQAVYLPFETKIEACLVRSGQYVKKNQPLFKLDLNVVEKEVYKLDIELLELKQNLYELEKNSLTLSEGALNLSQALKEKEYAHKRWQDSEKLVKAGVISEEEYGWDKRRYFQALDTYKKQSAMHRHLTNQSLFREKRILLNKKIKHTQSKLTHLKQYLTRPLITAVQEGLVLPVKLKSGDFYCLPGEKILSDQAIFWLASNESRRVELKMDQTELAQVKTGNKAEIMFMGYPGGSFLSEVLEINAIPEPNILPPKYRVYLKINSIEQVRLGTQARVKIYFE